MAFVRPDVDADGETALLWLGGAFSHAIRKGRCCARAPSSSKGLFAQGGHQRQDAGARGTGGRRAGAQGRARWAGRVAVQRGSTWSPGRTVALVLELGADRAVVVPRLRAGRSGTACQGDRAAGVARRLSGRSLSPWPSSCWPGSSRLIRTVTAFSPGDVGVKRTPNQWAPVVSSSPAHFLLTVKSDRLPSLRPP